MKRIVQGLLGFGVGALCLWLAFRGVVNADTGMSWHDIGGAILSVPPWAHVAFLAMFVGQVLLRTERWRVQARGLTGKKPGLRESAAINAAGFAAVFLLPFRLGEFVRPNLSASRGIMRRSSGLAATVLERAIDGIVTTGIFGILLASTERAVPDAVRAGGWVALAVFGGALVAFVIMFQLRERSARIAESMVAVFHEGLAKRVSSTIIGFLEGLACFRAPRDLAVYVVLTVAYWLLNAASMYVYMEAMNLGVPPEGALFCLCFLVIGVMIPAPPGNVGNFHAFARAALSIFGTAPAMGIAYAILLHAATTAAVVLWAALFFASNDLSFGGVRKAAAGSDEGPAP